MKDSSTSESYANAFRIIKQIVAHKDLLFYHTAGKYAGTLSTFEYALADESSHLLTGHETLMFCGISSGMAKEMILRPGNWKVGHDQYHDLRIEWWTEENNYDNHISWFHVIKQ